MFKPAGAPSGPIDHHRRSLVEGLSMVLYRIATSFGCAYPLGFARMLEEPGALLIA